MTARERRGRRRRRIGAGIAVALLLLTYPVLITLALWTGLVERLARSEDLKVDIQNPAYSIWPGRLHMNRVRVLVNGDTQFILEGKDMLAHIAILPLFRRKVHVLRLAADDVRYQMRVQVRSTKGIEERLAAYPKLEGLPGKNEILAPEAAKQEKREPTWTVEVEGIEVDVSELWFMEYRYLGHGTLRGEFLVGPQRMRVGTSVQNLGPGQLRFGARQVISRNLRGRITAAIPEVNPEAHADSSFLDFVDAHVELNADLDSVRHLGAYVKGAKIADGAGSLLIDVSLEKGTFGASSVVRYATDAVRVQGGGWGVKSDLELEIGHEPGTRGNDRGLPRVHSKSKATYVSFTREKHRTFTVGIYRHSERATLKSAQIGSQLALKKAELRFPAIETRDWDDLDAAFGNKTPVRAGSGRAEGSLTLDVDQHYVGRGEFKAQMHAARLGVSGIYVGADGSASGDLHLNLKSKLSVIDKIDVRLRNVWMRAGDQYVDGWWLNMKSRVVSRQGKTPTLQASTNLVARDAEPMLKALAAKGELSKIFPKIVKLGFLRLSLKYGSRGKITDVMVSSLQSNLLDVSGRLHRNGQRTVMAFVFGGEAVSVGIADYGDGIRVEPLAHEGWLNEQLLRFPKPIQLVAPRKP